MPKLRDRLLLEGSPSDELGQAEQYARWQFEVVEGCDGVAGRDGVGVGGKARVPEDGAGSVVSGGEEMC